MGSGYGFDWMGVVAARCTTGYGIFCRAGEFEFVITQRALGEGVFGNGIIRRCWTGYLSYRQRYRQREWISSSFGARSSATCSVSSSITFSGLPNSSRRFGPWSVECWIVVGRSTEERQKTRPGSRAESCFRRLAMDPWNPVRKIPNCFLPPCTDTLQTHSRFFSLWSWSHNSSHQPPRDRKHLCSTSKAGTTQQLLSRRRRPTPVPGPHSGNTQTNPGIFAFSLTRQQCPPNVTE